MVKVLQSSTAMAGATLLSRVLGLVRMMGFAWLLGGGWEAGAFVYAFMVPNLFRRLLGEGALTAAFVPTLKRLESEGSSKQMWEGVNAVLAALVMACVGLIVLVLGGLTLALYFGSWSFEWFIKFYLLRIMFPYMVLVCVAALFMAILNARGRFFIPAMGATMLNLVMIPAIFLVAPMVAEDAIGYLHVLAWAVLVAGFLQCAFQLPWLFKAGFCPRFVWPFGNPVVKDVVQKMIPGMIGVAAFQINVLLTQTIASYQGLEIVAAYDYAVRLMEMPQGVFTISMATVLLSSLSGFASKKDYRAFRTQLSEGILQLLFINVLASVLLVVLAEPMVQLFFQRGEFSEEDTSRAAQALQFLAPSLIGYSVVNLLARAFFSLDDTRTPMRIATFCLAINLFLALWLVPMMKHMGLGLANTVSSTLNAGLLFYAIKRKMPQFDLVSLTLPIVRYLLVGLLVGGLVWKLHQVCLTGLSPQTWMLRMLVLFVPMTGGGLAYFGLGLVFKDASALAYVEMIRGRFVRNA